MPRSLLPARWVDEQVPDGARIFLDHVAHFVGDLDQAADAIRRLGFAPSPINLQENVGDDGARRPTGTSNRVVRLRRGFLEFLAATSETALAQQLVRARARYQGLHLIAFSHADLRARRARLVAAGFDMQPLIRMQRRIDEAGARGTVDWSILRTRPGLMAEGRIQFVTPHTPHLAWPPGSMDHPNRADCLTGVMICAADPEEAKIRYGAFLGRDAAADGFTLDRGRVPILGAQAAAALPDFHAPSLPFIAAATIATADPAETRRVLESNGVRPLGERDGILWIGPSDALGCHLGFHASPDRLS